MPNRSTDALFQLIHSLQKQEKRNFKLYVKRNSSNEDMKIIQLFDALDAMSEYDEDVLLRKATSLKKQQLSNTKAHLYKQISLLVQVLFLEKKIETLHITRSMKDRAAQLIGEADDVNERLVQITKLSNLALQLYSWYINNGHARNEKDEREIENYFQTYLSDDLKKANGFYEKLYLYQSYCWYAFIRQDFLMYYRYTQHWVDLFQQEPLMIEIETASYIKGL